MDRDKVQASLRKYTYGKLEALDNKLKELSHIEYNPDEKTILIPNLYHQPTPTHEGECGELSLSLLDKLRKDYPNEFFYFANGTEPDHFPEGTHFFALKSQRELPCNAPGRLVHEKGIENLLAKSKEGLTIIDPSFKKIMPYSKSGYCIQGAHNKNATLTKNPDLILGDANYNPDLISNEKASDRRPLGFNDHNELVCLMANFQDQMNLDPEENFNPETILRVTLRKPGEFGCRQYETVYKNLDFLGSDRLIEIVSKLREIPLVSTTRSLAA
jgi:hypothetical protein